MNGADSDGRDGTADALTGSLVAVIVVVSSTSAGLSAADECVRGWVRAATNARQQISCLKKHGGETDAVPRSWRPVSCRRADAVRGETPTLPDAFAGTFGVVLFYRGSWCRYCNGQLRAFQRDGERLAEVGVKVAAVSADDEETTRELVAKLRLTFPVGHSADIAALSAMTGAFVDAERNYLQSTGFVLDPAGKVVVSVYSSGAVGRLVPEDVIGLVRSQLERAAQQPSTP